MQSSTQPMALPAIPSGEIATMGGRCRARAGRWLRLMLLLPMLMAGPALAQDTMTLNFKDTDINAVIGAVADFTGRNFIVDPRVKGKVTVVSSRPMASEEVYQVFLSVLKVHGFAAVPGPNVIKIVPEVNAKQEAVPTVTARKPGTGDEFVTRVIEIRNVDAAQLVPILRPLVPQRGHLAAYPPTNTLIISDSADNIARLAEIVQRIDLAVHEEIEVIPLQHASAGEVVRILDTLTQQEAKGRGAAATLNVVPDERTNSILLGGPPNSRLRLRAIITHLDTRLEVGGNTQVVYLRFADAKALVPVLTGVVTSISTEQKGQPPATAERVSIQAHESTNSLVINAPPDVFQSLRAVIDRLDVRRAQVLVEAVIAEVSTDRAAELGVQWAFDASRADNAVGLINFNGSQGIVGVAQSAAAGVVPPLDGISLGLGDFSGSFRFAALIRALSGTSSANILSTPTLVTMDNEEAEIVVGQNVPFVTGSFSSTGGTTTQPITPFQTIQRQDVGITLKIRPQINEGNAVRLTVEQEVSSIAPGTQGAADIITNKRAIRTSVMVEDNQVLVLGGLIEDRLTESQQKVPGLGDIPVLGGLFRYQRSSKEKTNLMVFLHPVILKDSAMQARYTNEKYNFVRAQQMGLHERGVPLMRGVQSPLLPEMQEILRLPPPYEDTSSQAVPSLPNVAPPALESPIE